MSAPHTPGPWWRKPDQPAVIYASAGGGGHAPVAKEEGYHGAREANARLIETAPDLLAACEAVLPLMIPGMNWTDETGQMVKAMVADAVKKATGK